MKRRKYGSKRRPGFSLIELLVVIGIIAVLLAILLPSLEKVREQGNNVRCASNLNQIGLGLTLYANDNHGNFPRTMYQPGVTPTAGTGINASDSFSAAGPQPNDVTAAIYLLIKMQRIPTQLFADPYNDEIQYEPDKSDPTTHSNFSDYKLGLAYSFANPYPDAAATKAGYQWTNKIGAQFALAADRNPGTGPSKNSRNHEGKGQNVLFGDGHAEWMTITNCGISHDEIFVNKNSVVNASPMDATDSVLLPAAQ